MVSVVAGHVLLGSPARSALIGFACEVTVCSAPGMVTAGWLIVALPAGATILRPR
ncbi:MAG TPA: hypothetical protein VGD43_11275 [Micromonospora sp.]